LDVWMEFGECTGPNSGECYRLDGEDCEYLL